MFALYSLISALLVASYNSATADQIFAKKTDIALDNNNRVTSNLLLYSGSDYCSLIFDSYQFAKRESHRIQGAISESFFGNTSNDCAAVCIEKGVASDHIFNPLLYQINTNLLEEEDPIRWVTQNCQAAEIAFINYAKNDAQIYYVTENGARVPTAILEQGEKKTRWIETFLGHQFDVVELKTYRLLARITVEENGFYTVGGEYPSKVQPMIVDEKVRNTFVDEWDKKNSVQRTFTEFGFNKGKLSLDIFASMSAFHYNNRNRAFREEWDGKGIFVNWWEKDVFYAPIPAKLKKYWQSRLKSIVEQWVGVELELTDIYGMRRYEEGARLLTHVDRQPTHACSLIINVAQGNIRKPWNVEIYDFADRLHEVEMNPGDIVYYESARCLHGRMQPLQGDFYVNLFAHYRPKLPTGEGDPEWFQRPNPIDTPAQIIDIGSCQSNGTLVECSGGEYGTPETLSPFLETLHGPDDLFRFWKETGKVAGEEGVCENSH